MVSTRGPRIRIFDKGEKVLCYEPDPTKAKVLYDSKILGTVEAKDKRGRKILQYKVHFQGWSSSWDRKVSSDLILKDTEANRRLQRDLAEKAQLQLGSYLYRKEQRGSSSSGSNCTVGIATGRKRLRRSGAVNYVDEYSSCSDFASGTSAHHSIAAAVTAVEDHHYAFGVRPRGFYDDNFASAASNFERHDDFFLKDDSDSDSFCSSSMESLHDEERVRLRMSDKLRVFLEYDHDMINRHKRQHILPAKVPAVAILENFVKQVALRLAFTASHGEGTRRRTTQQRTDKKERDYEKLVATVNLLKEVADGLRIYFDFTLADYLLYREEREYATHYTSEEFLREFRFSPPVGPKVDLLKTKAESDQAADGDDTSPSEPKRRKLRSRRTDECEVKLENVTDIVVAAMGGTGSINSFTYLKALRHRQISISSQTRDFLQEVLAWRILPANAAPAPSMIFGAPHLARLVVKMPDFLNASSMADDKLKILLQHLDTFVNFLETQREWFSADNYVTTRRSLSIKLAEDRDLPMEQHQQSQSLYVPPHRVLQLNHHNYHQQPEQQHKSKKRSKAGKSST